MALEFRRSSDQNGARMPRWTRWISRTRSLADQLRDQRRDLVEVLRVVEDEEHPSRPERAQDLGPRVLAGGELGAHGPRDGGQQGSFTRQGRQLDEAGALLEAALDLLGDLDRDPRLADAAGADQRQDAAPPIDDRPRHARDQVSPPDEGGERNGQRRRAARRRAARVGRRLSRALDGPGPDRGRERLSRRLGFGAQLLAAQAFEPRHEVERVAAGVAAVQRAHERPKHLLVEGVQAVEVGEHVDGLVEAPRSRRLLGRPHPCRAQCAPHRCPLHLQPGVELRCGRQAHAGQELTPWQRPGVLPALGAARLDERLVIGAHGPPQQRPVPLQAVGHRFVREAP
jgi:hypothetical protein